MSLSSYSRPIAEPHGYSGREGLQEGLSCYLSTLRDPQAAAIATRLVGTVPDIDHTYRHLETHQFGVALLEHRLALMPTVDDIVRLAYARYGDGSYRAEVSVSPGRTERGVSTFTALTDGKTPWAVCRARTCAMEEEGEISELFDLEERGMLMRARGYLELGRWVSHPVFDALKASPRKQAARAIQRDAMGITLRHAIASGLSYALPSYAIFAERVASWVSEHGLAKVTKIPSKRRPTAHRLFLERVFPGYWVAGNPGVYRIELPEGHS